jgi:hypothetical protein
MLRLILICIAAIFAIILTGGKILGFETIPCLLLAVTVALAATFAILVAYPRPDKGSV